MPDVPLKVHKTAIEYEI